MEIKPMRECVGEQATKMLSPNWLICTEFDEISKS